MGIALIFGLAIALGSAAVAQQPEPREIRENLIREKQTIGKVLVSPDGKFFLDEWRRPYSWDKDFDTLPANVAGTCKVGFIAWTQSCL